ncbi:hypothetical protein JOF56_005536 [Kibdelosporangium banguiense]|uniref:Uncharacterized protein n=1 Tax=Kibdelosporangium banguiense TaxID=1365924 RepID=A0ABS4TMN8_9PSEU|nr:hypothetical protein [Kibdelosporangium banguiense]MBP2325151.1 hypothetical protein [Kibdelosporangium banguiense]
MYAQLTYFNPRTPAEVAADEFAARERIVPLMHDFDVRAYVLRRDDGSQVIVTLADSEQILLDAQKAIINSKLLPGEDPALLAGADRVEIYPVVAMYPEGE